MNIEIAQYSGYCYGVERAFRMVKDTATRRRKNIYTLGPLIHNNQAVDALKNEQGISVVHSLDDVPSGTVIIRTHGLPPAVIDEAREKGLDLIDATCPFVKKAQNYARELVDDGYHLVIIGEKDHPEVIGIKAHAKSNADVVEDEEEARLLGVDAQKLGIVIQTTQESGKVGKIVALLAMKAASVKIYNTICDATHQRQFSARELAEKVDVMVVVGGKHSGNTRRLTDICRTAGARTYHIEGANEIEETWFKQVENVGVTAGASTPDFVLEQVIERLEDIKARKGV